MDKKWITLFYKNKKFEKKDEYKHIFLEKGDKNLHYKITVDGEIKTGTLTSELFVEYLVDKVLD